MQDRQVRQLRARLELSQERFAQLLGVSLQTVRRWESGLSKPLPIMNLRLEELHRAAGHSRPSEGGNPMAAMAGRAEGGAALGLGGLFKGIGSLLDLVGRLTEGPEEEATAPGEVHRLGGKLTGVYGLSIRLGLGGRPIIEQFGNIRETDAGPVVAETREPLVDVFHEEDQTVVIVELPGVEEQDIRLHVERDLLEVVASGGERRYQKEVLLPSAVDPQSLDTSYRNGVLEVRLGHERPAQVSPEGGPG